MNKKELVADVADRAELTKATARVAVDALLDAISRSLAEGKELTLVGFGAFKAHSRPARMGRNPQTGDPLPIKAAKRVKFTPGKGLKEAVQEGVKKSEASKPRK